MVCVIIFFKAVCGILLIFERPFFLKNFFQELGAFFTTTKALICASYFFAQKINFIVFFKVLLSNFNVTFRTYFKNLFEKTEKK